jgi:pyrimidine-nucleoside phosphorylase
MSSFNIVNLIRKKRDGFSLTREEIQYLIDRYTQSNVPDYQMSAFLMAAFLNGMDADESAALTHAMLHSGSIVDLSEISGIKVDKHSTGGVGDKVSILLAPIVASCGVPVPMISGRGLGHSGGTLDKLESIPGFDVNLDLERYKEVLQRHNLVLIGQTKEIAPADKKLYALRDVTATVEFIPFIASSIMSKKLAEGIDALVLDVKWGSGAFMKSPERALELAQTLVNVGEAFGKKTIAYITAMNQPLGYAVGNWLETKEAIRFLREKADNDLMQVTHLLAGTMIFMGGKASSVDEGIEMSREQVRNGQAFQKLKDIVSEQGGDIKVIEDPDSYPSASHRFEVRADSAGYIEQLDAFQIALGCMDLGAGRQSITDHIDPTAGAVLHKKVGEFVNQGETILTAHTNKPQACEEAERKFREAIHISDHNPKPQLLVSHIIDSTGQHPYRI